MDKYVEDILSKSQYGQMVIDILRKSQYGQIRKGYPQEILVWTKTSRVSLVNLCMDKNVNDILSKSQYGQIRRGYPQ